MVILIAHFSQPRLAIDASNASANARTSYLHCVISVQHTARWLPIIFNHSPIRQQTMTIFKAYKYNLKQQACAHGVGVKGEQEPNPPSSRTWPFVCMFFTSF